MKHKHTPIAALRTLVRVLGYHPERDPHMDWWECYDTNGEMVTYEAFLSTERRALLRCLKILGERNGN